MWIIATILFFLQGAALLVDEVHFHYQRHMPRWERVGHPIDTLSFLICLIFVIWVPFTAVALKVYVVLAGFSCLLVTKDEFFHKHHCLWTENWLHALLFILHPITLTLAGLLWPVVQGQEVASWLAWWLDDAKALRIFLFIEIGFVGLFFIYQVVAWNFIWKEQNTSV